MTAFQAVFSLVLAIKEGRAKGQVSVPEPSDIGTRRGESFRTIDSKRKEAHRFFGYFLIAAKSSYKSEVRAWLLPTPFTVCKENEQRHFEGPRPKEE